MQAMLCLRKFVGQDYGLFFVTNSWSYVTHLKSMNTFPKHDPNGWVKSILGPLVAALIAGFGAFISVQKEMAVVASSVDKMSVTLTKVAEKQANFFETFYLPLAVKVEKQESMIQETRTTLQFIKDDIRMYHNSSNNKDKGGR